MSLAKEHLCKSKVRNLDIQVTVYTETHDGLIDRVLLDSQLSGQGLSPG